MSDATIGLRKRSRVFFASRPRSPPPAVSILDKLFIGDLSPSILLMSAVCRSENCWSRRFVLTMDGNKEVAFPGRLTGVVFGAKMTQESRGDVAKLLVSSVEYMKAFLSDRKYDLKITTIQV